MRFIFVRPLPAYLRISPPRDAIERPIEGALDFSGWDLRKALGLMLRSNAVVLEWLRSPVVYRSDPAVADLKNMASMAVHLPALAYHYDRLARRAWARGDGEVRLKSYFYALRPILALRWLREFRTPSPMDLISLMAGVDVPEAVETVTRSLLVRKAAATEATMIPREPVLERFLWEELSQQEPRPTAWDQERSRVAADCLFRKLVASE